MDFSLKKEEYKLLKTIVDNSIEECVEAEFTLPEYMPEILRIVKSSAEPKIDSCRLVGERVTVDGTCELRMVYVSEDGELYCFSQSRPFTRYCENSGFAEGVDATVKANVSYVNCRATGTKRAEIKAGVSLKVTVYKADSQEVISLGERGCIEEKSVSLRGMSLGCRKTRRFSMSDNIPLSVPSAFVLSYGASAVCSDIKKINNKIMIKGEAIVDVCYVNANNKNETERIRHTLPINQILEFEGMEEQFIGNIFLRASLVDVIQKNDGDSFGNSFDISLGIDASATMWEEKALVIISDAYAVGASIELKKTPRDFYRGADEIKDILVVKENIKVSGEGISAVSDCRGEVTSVDVKLENSSFIVFGTISLSFILKDVAGGFSSFNKVIDYRLEKKTEFSGEAFKLVPDVVLTSVDFNENGSNSVDIRCELRICGSVFEKVSVEAVTDIKESAERFVSHNNAITVYFPDGEESLWAIARRYNTTVGAIASENGLDGETTEGLKIIFIPAV